MGKNLIDQYSLLHFSVGVVSYFWGVRGLVAIGIHTLFELIENTQFGMNVINNIFKGIWPGGKNNADTYLNIFGDTVSFTFGWILAQQLDKFKSHR